MSDISPLVVWIFYNIRKEMIHFVQTRQEYLITTEHASSVQANTLLVTGIPAKYLTQESLNSVLKDLPGGVKRIWINRWEFSINKLSRMI